MPRRDLQSVVFFAALTLIFLLVAGLSVISYDRIHREAETTATNLTETIRENIEQTFIRSQSDIDVFARLVTAEDLSPRLTAQRRAEIEMLMENHLRRFPQIVNYRIFDADGQTVMGAGANKANFNVSDREWFRSLRENPANDLAISDVIVGKGMQAPTVILSVPVRGPDRRFLGAVNAALDLSSIQRVIDSPDIGANGLISIRRTETSKLILRRPQVLTQLNEPVLTALTRRVLAGENSGVVDFISKVDNIGRISSFQRTRDFPFVVIVGLAHRDFMRPWIAQTIATGTVTLIFAALLLSVFIRQQKSQERLANLSRLYKARSVIDETIVRTPPQEELFALACRCAVDYGGMMMSFVCVHDAETHLFLPVSRFGVELDYVDQIRLTSNADEPEGRGPIATAFRENRPVVVNDYLKSPLTSPWKALAAPRGWKSAAAFPILRAGKVFAVLSVYHRRRNAFDEESVTELDEMSRNISFAIDNYLREELRTKADEELKDKNRKLVEQSISLERSNADLEQFAYVASHDLREPLRMISNYIELLGKRYSENFDADGRKFLGFVRQGAVRMDRMVLDLLEFSRVGRRGDALAPVALAEAVGTAIDNLRLKIKDAQADITVAAHLPVVVGAHGELVRLFQNLIGNALKYRHPERQPRISIGVEAGAGEWIVSVADNGIGIDARFFDRIFEIFQRLHLREEYEGTGIGLAICRKIVGHHGGRIWVDSTKGEGTVFFFSLPQTPSAPSLGLQGPAKPD